MTPPTPTLETILKRSEPFVKQPALPYNERVIDILLQTKLYIPITRSSLVPRSRLLAQLNAGVDGRLTLVSAPARFGKTTLIVQWPLFFIFGGIATLLRRRSTK